VAIKKKKCLSPDISPIARLGEFVQQFLSQFWRSSTAG
jgi:hypothetical protein